MDKITPLDAYKKTRLRIQQIRKVNGGRKPTHLSVSIEVFKNLLAYLETVVTTPIAPKEPRSMGYVMFEGVEVFPDRRLKRLENLE